MMSQCSCKEILNSLRKIDQVQAPETREPAYKLAKDAFWGGLVYGDVAIEMKELLDKHVGTFSNCQCKEANYLRLIYIHPIIKESDRFRRTARPEEQILSFRKILWKGGEPMAKTKKQKGPQPKKCPKCSCELPAGEEAVCHCDSGCSCCSKEQKP